jgi:hypothetical protein
MAFNFNRRGMDRKDLKALGGKGSDSFVPEFPPVGAGSYDRYAW